VCGGGLKCRSEKYKTVKNERVKTAGLEIAGPKLLENVGPT